MDNQNHWASRGLTQSIDVRLIRLVSHATQINEGHVLGFLALRCSLCCPAPWCDQGVKLLHDR